MKAALDGLDAVNGDLSDGQEKYREALQKLKLKTPTGEVTLDENRQAIGTTFITEVAKDADGTFYNKVLCKVDAKVDQTARHEEGGVRQDGSRLARRAELPVGGSGRQAMASITDPAQRELPLAPVTRSLEGVTRTFGALRAIEDVSFSVAAGERRAVIGANGAGKTTLFNAITGDFPPTAGRVRFFGEDVTAHAALRAHPHGHAAHLPVLAAVPRPHGAGQSFPRRARRRARALQLPAPAAAQHHARCRTDDLLERVRLDARGAISRCRRCRTASSASSRSAWRWPARRA